VIPRKKQPAAPDGPRVHDFKEDAGLLRTELGGRSWQAGVSFRCRCGATARPVPGGKTYYFDKSGNDIDPKGACEA
jgi:hypothetical protein